MIHEGGINSPIKSAAHKRVRCMMHLTPDFCRLTRKKLPVGGEPAVYESVWHRFCSINGRSGRGLQKRGGA